MKRSTVIEIIAFLFIILFLYTGIAKLMEYDIAVEQIALTPILAPIAKYVVIMLPIAEMLTAIVLFLPATRRAGLYLSLALMVTFTGYVIYILNYNDKLPCTCGGVLQAMSWPAHLVFNIGFIGLAATALILGRNVKGEASGKINKPAWSAK